jgi:hypothetical protein
MRIDLKLSIEYSILLKIYSNKSHPGITALLQVNDWPVLI